MRQQHRAVLGLAISTERVHAVLVNRRGIAWSGDRETDPERPLAELLCELAAASGARAPRTSLAVAVGPGFAQLRQLHGLPAVRDRRVLAAIVQQSAGRYFRQNGTPITTTPPCSSDGDAPWVGAIEEPLVDAVAETGRTLRFASTALVPSAVVLGHAAPGCAFTWRDGEVALELRYDGARLAACRCLPARLSTGVHGGGAVLDGPLAALGPDALHYADAYGAARGTMRSTAAVLRPAGAIAEPTGRRLALASAACGLGFAFLLAAPSLASARAERRAAAELASVASAARGAERSERALGDNARLLARLAEFRRGMTSKTLLLGALTCAIDDETMLVSLQLEPSGGMLTARTPSPAALLEKLARVPDIASPAIVGSVTPEPPGPPTPNGMPQSGSGSESTEALQRVTIHFGWREDHGARRLVPRCPE